MSRWYESGLRFECTRCGNCCTGAPGTVLVSDTELAALAESLELSSEQFRAAFTRTLRGGAVSLREGRDGSCVFYGREHGCSVHPLRPRQCRSWPFWRGVAASQDSWSAGGRELPGHEPWTTARSCDDRVVAGRRRNPIVLSR